MVLLRKRKCKEKKSKRNDSENGDAGQRISELFNWTFGYSKLFLKKNVTRECRKLNLPKF
jgi:hypothetical protein